MSLTLSSGSSHWLLRTHHLSRPCYSLGEGMCEHIALLSLDSQLSFPFLGMEASLPKAGDVQKQSLGSRGLTAKSTEGCRRLASERITNLMITTQPLFFSFQALNQKHAEQEEAQRRKAGPKSELFPLGQVVNQKGSTQGQPRPAAQPQSTRTLTAGLGQHMAHSFLSPGAHWE